MKKYRRIEVNAYHRRVTVVSGAWCPDESFEGQPSETEDRVSLNESDACEPVEPDSPEGQLLLVEAVRSLEQRLSADARAALRNSPAATVARRARFSRSLYAKLYCLRHIINYAKSTRRTR